MIVSPLKRVSSSPFIRSEGSFHFKKLLFRTFGRTRTGPFPFAIFTVPLFPASTSHYKTSMAFGVSTVVPTDALLIQTWAPLIMSWKASLSRHLPVVRFFGCPKSPASRGIMWVASSLFLLAFDVMCVVIECLLKDDAMSLSSRESSRHGY